MRGHWRPDGGPRHKGPTANSSHLGGGGGGAAARSTDEQADRAIKENCPGLTTLQTDGVHNKDGQTLREVVLAKKRESKQKGCRFGSTFWRDLGNEFLALSFSAAGLQVRDRSETVVFVGCFAFFAEIGAWHTF